MKTPCVVALAALLTAVSGAMAAEVRIGDSPAVVREALGAPRGQVMIEGRQVYYYERGEVEFTGDQVSRVVLRTPEEQAALDARDERIRSEREARFNQLLAEGTALRDSKLTDDAFKAAPLAYQVAYWERLARNYPGVSVSEPLTIARLRLNEQVLAKREKEEQAARIAELEARLAEAESRDSYYPLYTSYGYGRYRRPYYPPSLGPIEYHFQTASAAPYETPRGNPYEVPRGAPYSTPTASPVPPLSGPLVNFPSYNPALPPPRYDFFPDQNNDSSDRGRSGRGDNRGGRWDRGRY